MCKERNKIKRKVVINNFNYASDFLISQFLRMLSNTENSFVSSFYEHFFRGSCRSLVRLSKYKTLFKQSEVGTQLGFAIQEK